MALHFDDPNNPLGTIEIGENQVQFGQDFAYYKGIPPEEYQVFDMGSGFKLVAPGYGDMSQPGQYGNGALWVSKSQLHKLPTFVSC